MHRDERLLARNAYVLPGGVLAFYGMLGIAAVAFTGLRSPACDATGQVLLGGICWNLLRWSLAAALVGFGLVGWGLVRHHGRPEHLQGHLLAGTGVHVALVLLGSFAVLPFLAALVRVLSLGAEAGTAVTRIEGTEFNQLRLLLLAGVVGLLMFLPFLALHLHHATLRRAFLHHAMEETVDAASEAHEASEAEDAEEPMLLDQQRMPLP